MFAFTGREIEGKVRGKTLVGLFDKPLPIPALVDPAHYKFAKISDLTGRFKGHVIGRKLSITYDKGGATITGEANEGFRPVFFTGETRLE